MTMISENVSEKPKRGRPGIRDIDPTTWALARKCVPDEATSHRSVANQVYINSALAALGMSHGHEHGEANRRAYGWLIRVTPDDPDWFRRLKLRRVILTELGRIEDDDQLREVALAICERKPSTREAVAMIRRWRLGKSAGGDVDGLRGELIRHLNDYLRRHLDTPWEVVAEAVDGVLESVKESAGKGKGAV